MSLKPTRCPVQETDERRGSRGVLALFPGLQTVGGVQVSGELAWEAIAESCESRFCDAYLFSYGDVTERASRRGGGRPVSTASKLKATMFALRGRWPIRLVLVWHLGLLKLIPFLRVSDSRIVVFLHGIEAWRRQNWLTRSLLRRVDLFLSNTEYTWETFIANNAETMTAPHRAVHLGIGAPLEGRVPPPSQPPTVLMISRLLRSEDYKGHRELIAAWPLVLERIPEAELWIAGDGDLGEDLVRMAQARRLEKQVRFLGAVSEDQKQELLARSRCLAMPSRGEGFGLAYLEAMRFGRPCLVSTLDGGREVINPPEAGLAADPFNPPDVADKVCRLLTPGPEWDRWSMQARERYESRFTAEKFQQRLLTALQGVGNWSESSA